MTAVAARIRDSAILRAIAITLLLSGCATGAFFVGRALQSRSGSAAVPVRTFAPRTIQVRDVRALSLGPGLPALARR